MSPVRRKLTPVGLMIAQAMARMDLTQAEVARRLGVSQPSVSRWMGTDMLPAREIMYRLAAVLNIDATALLEAAARVRPDRVWFPVPPAEVAAPEQTDPQLLLRELAVLLGPQSPLRRSERRSLIRVLNYIVGIHLD